MRRPIFGPKDGGRMEGRQELRRPGGLQNPAALLHQAEIGTQGRSRGSIGDQEDRSCIRVFSKPRTSGKHWSTRPPRLKTGRSNHFSEPRRSRA